MSFQLDEAISVLERTPDALHAMLHGMGPGWTQLREGPQSWSAHEIIAHLIIGEQTDWIPRARIMLGTGEKNLAPFDMTAHLDYANSRNGEQLLTEFKSLRLENLKSLHALQLQPGDLDADAVHPEFGRVTLRQHLSSWVVHDLNHLSQINRIWAGRYGEETGPWKNYLRILNT